MSRIRMVAAPGPGVFPPERMSYTTSETMPAIRHAAVASMA
jgi:hypothetical protein